VNGDPYEVVDVADINYLISFAFKGGPPPSCMLEADVNGSGGDADIADVSYLVEFSFKGGSPPHDCP
jgi:hypothetical protein